MLKLSEVVLHVDVNRLSVSGERSIIETEGISRERIAVIRFEYSAIIHLQAPLAIRLEVTDRVLRIGKATSSFETTAYFSRFPLSYGVLHRHHFEREVVSLLHIQLTSTSR